MKKYISGSLAIAFAVICFAFTQSNTLGAYKASDNAVVGKKASQWFCISLTCAQQSLAPSQVLNPANYAPCTPSCPQTNVCVCAIFAQTDASGKPIINSSIDPTLFAQLSDYAADGDFDNPHNLVQTKTN